MPGSRNFTIRTPLQKVSQTTDGTRPPGLTTAVPVRLSQDFGGKTSGTFRTNPTSAAIVRRKNHDGLQSFLTGDWSAVFGQEVYGGYNPVALDTKTGELTSAQYTAIGAVDGAYAQIDARLVSAPCVTDTNCFVIDTKLSRDGRYTYTLTAAHGGTGALVYFNVIDNLTGVQKSPTLNLGALPGGKFDLGAAGLGPLVSIDGNIAVVDDSTSQDAVNHMAYNSALFVVQALGLTGGVGTTMTYIWRYDFTANDITMLDGGHIIGTSSNPTYVARAFVKVHLVVQVAGTLVAIVAYRATFAPGPPDSGQIAFAKLTSWVAGAAPVFAARYVSTAPFTDFSSPPATAVSRRGSISTSRKFYLYAIVTTGSVSTLVWYVIDPSTFWAAGTCDQIVSTVAYTPAGTTYVGMKAAPLPTSYIAAGNPCMAVGFVYKNTTTNTTAIKLFLHTTSLSGDASGAAITLDTFPGIQPVFEIGVGVCADSAGDQARVAVAYLSPHLAYAYSEVRCTDMTNISVLSQVGGDINATTTNATLNTVAAGMTANRFAFAMSMWNDTATAFSVNKNDIQAIIFLKSDRSSVSTRVSAPFVAIGLVWDADLYENLPNPSDPSTNQRVTTFYALGTGANDSGYVAGAMLAGFRTTPGYNSPSGDGHNTADLGGAFSPTTASPDTLANAALEISPAYVYPWSGVVTFFATMNDEFTFTVSSWGSGPQLPGQIAVGMTLVLTVPAFAVGRYTISGVTYDPIGESVTAFTVSQRVQFLSAAFTPTTTFTGYVSVGPSTSIRQLLLPRSSNGGNNRQGNVIFPPIIQLDYVKIATLPTNSEICELAAPLGSGGVAPASASVLLRGYNLDDDTTPNNPAAGIEVSLSLDDGVTWVTKVLSTTGTSSVTGTTGFSSFGVQSFSGGWYPIPALIKEGDFLFVDSGPNAGTYSISGLQPSIGPELYVDRPFPAPGDATVANFIVSSATNVYLDDPLTGTRFGLVRMNFDLSGLPFILGSGVMHVRVECKDQASGPNSYEFDSITVQWTP